MHYIGSSLVLGRGIGEMEKNLGYVLIEQMLEYVLKKTNQYKTIEEFREQLKKEINNIHDKNMKNLNDCINNH